MDHSVNINKLDEVLTQLSSNFEQFDSVIDKWINDTNGLIDDNDEELNNEMLQIMKEENDVITHCRQLKQIITDNVSSVNIINSGTQRQPINYKIKSNDSNRKNTRVNVSDSVIFTVFSDSESGVTATKHNGNCTSPLKKVFNPPPPHEKNKDDALLPLEDLGHRCYNNEDTLLLQADNNLFEGDTPAHYRQNTYELSKKVYSGDIKIQGTSNIKNIPENQCEDYISDNRSFENIVNTDGKYECHTNDILQIGKQINISDQLNQEKSESDSVNSTFVHNNNEKDNSNIRAYFSTYINNSANKVDDCDKATAHDSHFITEKQFAVSLSQTVEDRSTVQTIILKDILPVNVTHFSNSALCQNNDDSDHVLLLQDDNDIDERDTPAHHSVYTHESSETTVNRDEETEGDMDLVSEKLSADTFSDNRDLENILNRNVVHTFDENALLLVTNPIDNQIDQECDDVLLLQDDNDIDESDTPAHHSVYTHESSETTVNRDEETEGDMDLVSEKLSADTFPNNRDLENILNRNVVHTFDENALLLVTTPIDNQIDQECDDVLLLQDDNDIDESDTPAHHSVYTHEWSETTVNRDEETEGDMDLVSEKLSADTFPDNRDLENILNRNIVHTFDENALLLVTTPIDNQIDQECDDVLLLQDDNDIDESDTPAHHSVYTHESSETTVNRDEETEGDMDLVSRKLSADTFPNNRDLENIFNRNVVHTFDENALLLVTPPIDNQIDQECDDVLLLQDDNDIDESDTPAHHSVYTHEWSETTVNRDEETEGDMDLVSEKLSADTFPDNRDLENILNRNVVHTFDENALLLVTTPIDNQIDQECDDVLLLQDDNDIDESDTPAHHSVYTHESSETTVNRDEETEGDMDLVSEKLSADTFSDNRDLENILNRNFVHTFDENDLLLVTNPIDNKIDQEKVKDVVYSPPGQSYCGNDDVLLLQEDFSCFDSMGGGETPAYYLKYTHEFPEKKNINIKDDINRTPEKRLADSTTTFIKRQFKKKSFPGNVFDSSEQNADESGVQSETQSGESLQKYTDTFDTLKLITSPISDVTFDEDQATYIAGDEPHNDYHEIENDEDVGHVQTERFRTHVGNTLCNKNIAKITLFNPYCFFNLTTVCTKDECRFSHEIPSTVDVKRKLKTFHHKLFIQEYRLMREWSTLRRTFGICYVEECVRRNLTTVLVEMAIDFINMSNKKSEEDLNLKNKIIEATLVHFNDADLRLCEDLLMTIISSQRKCLCNILVEEIAVSQDFSRFVSAFKKLTYFINRVGGPISLFFVEKILHRVCNVSYELSLARALIRILKFTSRRIFTNPLIQQFEELTKADKILNEEFLSLKNDATSHSVASAGCSRDPVSLNTDSDQVSSTSQHLGNRTKVKDTTPILRKRPEKTSINQVDKARAQKSYEDSKPHVSKPVVEQPRRPKPIPKNIHHGQLYVDVKAVHRRKSTFKINPWKPCPKPSTSDGDENT